MRFAKGGNGKQSAECVAGHDDVVENEKSNSTSVVILDESGEIESRQILAWDLKNTCRHESDWVKPD